MSQYDYEWTIMLYLSGDNSLSEDMVRSLNDISRVGAPPGIAITVQYDPRATGLPTFVYAFGKDVPAGKPELAREIEAEFGPFPIPNHVKDRVTNENSADPKVLADFIRWSTRKYSSKYRMLILSGHGSGAVGDFLTDSNAENGEPSSLSIPGLRKALQLARDGSEKRRHGEPLTEMELKSGGGEPRLLHVLGMDSCLMGMAEICCEVKEFVDYLVGSEGFVPNAGWPYDHLLTRLQDRCRENQDKTPENMARWIVEDVVKHYKAFLPAGVSIDMAACKLQELPTLTNAVRALTTQLRKGLADLHIQDLIVAAHWRAQSYKREQHTDLSDFCTQLMTIAMRSQLGSGKAELLDTCLAVVEAVKGIACKQDLCGVEFQHSHGLSVYFPWSAAARATLPPYSELCFPAKGASDWSDFLDEYLVQTQRKVLGAEDAKTEATAVRDVTAAASLFGGGHADSLTTPTGGHKEAERLNREAERLNREAERLNRFITELFSGFGANAPWSMKNPPTRPPVLAPPPAPGPSVPPPETTKSHEART